MRQSRWFHSLKNNSRRTHSGDRSSHRIQVEILEELLMLDATGPRILFHAPEEVRNDVFDHIEIDFNEEIDSGTLSVGDVSLSGPDASAAVTSVQHVSGNTFRVNFTPLSVRGNYKMTIGPGIHDLNGNPMDQNQDGINGGPSLDQYVASLVYIDADAIFTDNTLISEDDTTYDGMDLLIDGSIVTIDGQHSFNSVHIVDGGTVTHSANTTSETHKLDISIVEQLIIDSTSSIDVSGKGYLAGRTSGNTTIGGASGRTGGSYGGMGGTFEQQGETNTSYGDYADPEDWGSGGSTTGGLEGVGGGLVRLTASRFELNGEVNADGSDGGGNRGSGGGIHIAVDELTGTGTIHADGGSSLFNVAGAGGGGGRVAVYSLDLSEFDTGSITASGGTYLHGGDANGGAGTVYLRDPDLHKGTLIIDGSAGGDGITPLGLPDQEVFAISDDVLIRGSAADVRPNHSGVALDFQAVLTIQDEGLLSIGESLHLGATSTTIIKEGGQLHVGKTLTLDGEVSIDTGSQLRVDVEFLSSQPIVVFGATVTASKINIPTLSVVNGGLVTSLTSTASQMYMLALNVSDTLIVDSTSSIDVSGKGYLAGRTSGNTTIGGASGRTGGSYGGMGGTFEQQGETNTSYGDYADPEDWGSGGSTTGGLEGVGGGLVRLTASIFELNGEVNADGSDGGGNRGSGGGIHIAVDELTGTGTIHADGGSSPFNVAGAGGGGGRVAIYAQDFTDFDTTSITAVGGTYLHGGAANGTAGTIHVVQGRSLTHVRSHAPSGNDHSRINQPFDHVELRFNKPIDLSTFGINDLSIEGPLGNIAYTDISLVGDRRYRIDFPSQNENGYYFFTLEPTLRDAEGFHLDQNANGNPGESDDAYSFNLVLDTVAPRVARHSPAGDITGTIDHVELWFSEFIDPVTLTASDIEIADPNGNSIPINGIHEIGLGRFRIEFSPLSINGQYRILVGPSVRDLAGNHLNTDGDDVFGETGEDVYEATFNFVPVDLELTNVTVTNSELIAGEGIDLFWEGGNASGTELVGEWTDGVYLSLDDNWDIFDQLIATVDHTDGLASRETYSATASAYVPGALPDQYHILVRTDVFNVEKELNEEGNNVIASTPLTLSVQELTTDGIQQVGEFTSLDGADYYAVSVLPGESIRLELQADSVNNELYVAFESIPTRLQYDHRVSTVEQNQQLVFTGHLAGGTYYVLAYADQVAGTANYQLSAHSANVHLESISPDHYGNAGVASVTLTGAGFDSSTTVELVDSLGTPNLVTDTQVISDATMLLNIDMSAFELGLYDVRVQKGEQDDVLPAAFSVLEAGEPSLQTTITAPDLRPIGVATIWVAYRNDGTVAMPSPLFKVEAGRNAYITSDRALADTLSRNAFPDSWPPVGISSTVQLSATGSGATPGVLQPGDSGRIPVYYVGVEDPFNDGDVVFTLGELTSEDATRVICDLECVEVPLTIDWDLVRTQTQPETVAADAWKAVFYNLERQIGELWSDYSATLARNRNELAHAGDFTQDVGDLFSYELAKANAALSPINQLAFARDASVEAAGFPLAFQRSYGQSILSRFKSGTLGRGWTHNWDIRVQPLENRAIIHGPNGTERTFTRNNIGFYSAATGDSGLLTNVRGNFQLIEADQTVWQFDEANLLEYVEDSNGNRVTLSYDGSSQLTSLSHSSGAQLSLAYVNGKLSRLTDPVGPGPDDDRTTIYEYDGLNEHLVRVIEPDDGQTTYSYQVPTSLPQSHALASIKYADGTLEVFEYDDRGRLVRTHQGDAEQGIQFIYDQGQVSIIDGTGRTVGLTFRHDGQIGRAVDGNGRQWRLTYDDFGLTELFGPSTESYSYAYDSRSNLLSIRDALNLATSFAYEPQTNQLSSFTDPRGNGIEYQHDVNGNLTTITYEDGTIESFAHDTDGNVLSWTNRRGQSLVYTYNSAGQITSKDDPTLEGIDYVYAYDLAGNLTSASGANGTTSFEYDSDTDDLIRIDYPGGQFFVFAYNEVGQRTFRQDQGGDIVNYVYDSLGRLDVMTDGSGSLIVDYDYDDAGRLQTKSLGNGVFATYTYDAAGQVTSLINRRADQSVVSQFDYTYDASGRRTSMTTLDGTFHYSYDPLGQLTQVIHPGGRIVQYVYDSAGNRIEVVDDGVATSYTTNNLNQYTNVGGVTYTYDSDGNLISKNDNGVVTNYTYNIDNKLVEVSTPSNTWQYVYDAFDNRVGTIHNGVATKYVIDPIGLGNVAAEFDNTGNLVARYEHGFGLISRADSTGDPAYYSFSAIGSTSELTNTTGQILNTYSYDPFGESLRKQETTPNSFEFVGELGVLHEDSGLEFMRARYYDSSDGRFIQDDPIGIQGGSNLYGYTGNAPVSFVDPSGLSLLPLCPTLGTLGGLVTTLVLVSTGPFAAWVVPTAAVFSTLFVTAVCNALTQGTTQSSPPSSPPSTPTSSATPVPPPAPPSSPPPSLPGRPTNSTTGNILYAFDPNDKISPIGFGIEQFIQAETEIPYTVRFENMADATAPAARIVITDNLDDDLDLTTFELIEIALADQVISIPPGLNHYEASVPIVAMGIDIFVDINVDLDFNTRELSVDLMAIDPTTGWIPEDPLIGILYPNDETGRGEGHISYLVYPSSGLSSGTEITNRASIVFDFNDPIETPLVRNTIDSQSPTSSIDQLPATTTETTFTLDWSGRDESGGSGIASYDIFTSVDDGPFVLLLDDTNETSITLTREIGSSYAFYSVATDNVGYRESKAPIAEATIRTVDGTAPVLDGIPEDIVLEATGPSGAVVSYDVPTATDDVDPNPAILCTHSSGFTFPLGVTQVTCTATDSSNNSSQDSFDVTVVDTTAPILSQPEDQEVEATGPSGAIFDYLPPSVQDAVDPSPNLACSPRNGSQFRLGTTEVTCSAEDTSGNTVEVNFKVTVIDTTPPQISEPASIVVTAASDIGSEVTFELPTAVDLVSGETGVFCTDQSGTLFSVGTHTVTCTSQDDAENASEVAFDITVNPPKLVNDVFILRTSGFLLVKGDREDNSILVEQVGNLKIRVSGLNGTTIEGGTEPVVIPITRSQPIRVSMVAGDDHLEIGRLTRDLQVFAGPGNDTLVLSTIRNGHKGTINAGSGSDIVSVHDAVLEGDYRLLTFGGDDRVVINNSKFRAKAIFSTGGGDDFIAIDDSVFDKTLTIQASKDDDRLEIERSGNPDGKPTIANSKVQIRSISGLDHVLIGQPFSKGNSFLMNERKSLLIDGGLDHDILDAGTLSSPNSNGNRFSKRNTLRGFETVK